MDKLNLCVLEGDGIGPEITREAVKVLRAVCDTQGIACQVDHALLGGCAIDAEGVPLPMKTVEKCRASDAVLLGAVGGAVEGNKWDSLPPHLRPEAGLLELRAKLGLYANLRPSKVYQALQEASPLKPEIVRAGVDMVVVRELTGGIYFGEKGRKKIDGVEAAYDIEVYSVSEVERIARIAFDMAMMRRRHVTSVDKANVLQSSQLWRQVIQQVAKEYPEVEVTHMYVDNAAMQLVRNPAQFDVLVTSNLFGDILSDESAMISGSIGMLPSASLGYSKVGLFEPIHGSAPDIAGKGIANPLATILSLSMMFRYSFEMPKEAGAIEQAVEEVLNQYRTPDIQSEQGQRQGLKTVSTTEMGDAAAEAAVRLLRA